MTARPKQVLLDTHVWIWLNNGSLDLSPAVRDVIEEAGSNGGVFIPAIAVWEAAMLAVKGRIVLRPDARQWVGEALAQPGVEVAPLSPEVALDSSCLPEGLEGDPADRLIVATSRVMRIPLITRDVRILRYGERQHVATLKA